MSRRANPTLIGAFTLGAIALVVAAIVIFSSASLFTRRPKAVMFFQGDIQGLNVGAPVNLRGVQVGVVTDIRLDADPQTAQLVIPVYIEFYPERFGLEKKTEISAVDLAHQQPLRTAIDKGLHARLASQSLVTGQLLVELDLDPNEPRTFSHKDPKMVEIPTTQSDLEKLKNALMALPLDQLAGSAIKLMQDADRLVNLPDLRELLQSLVALSSNASGLITDTRGDLAPLMGNVNDVLHSAGETLTAAQGAVADLRTTLKSSDRLLSTDVREAVKTATATLVSAEKTLADLRGMLAPNSAQRYDLDQTLKNLNDTSRSLRVFADQLERRPNAVIMGK